MCEPQLICETEILSATDMGRTASHYYVKYDTIEVFNTEINKIGTDCVPNYYSYLKNHTGNKEK